MRDIDPDAIIQSAVSFSERRRVAELNLVAAILPDHTRLARVASDFGIRRRHFFWDDLAIIYASAASEPNRLKIGMLIVAMNELMRENFWDDEPWHAPGLILGGHDETKWNCRGLAQLGQMWFPSVTVVEHYARSVIDLFGRQLAADKAYRDCVGALEGVAA